MSGLFLFGRVLVGGYFLFNAYEHFANVSRMAEHAASRGVPMPTAAVLGAGVLLAIGGVTFLLGVMPKLGVAAMVLFLVPVTLFMHSFWTDTTAGARMMNQVHFAKNLGLLGAMFMFLAIPEPWPYSVAQRLRFRRELPASRMV